MPKDARIRLRFIVGLIGLFGALLIGRLYELQIIRSDEFLQEAKDQYIASVPNIYKRGSIAFTQKDGKYWAGATTNEGYIIALNPQLLPDKEEAYRALAAIIPLDRAIFMEKAGKEKDPYEEIATRIPEDKAFAIKALKID